MKRTIIILAVLMAGCSSFNMGAVCYLPHGEAATCQIQVMPAKPTSELRTPS